MEIKKSTILGIQFWNTTKETIISHIQKIIRHKGKQSIAFINADCLNICFKDEDYKNLLETHPCLLPDGAGIKIACRILGEQLVENLNGTDLMVPLLKMANNNNYSIFLLGAGEPIVKKMKSNLEEQYPSLNICGYHHGYFNKENGSQSVVDAINEVKPNILFVAFGAPLQEKWIAQNQDQLDANVILGVGGLFDFFSGHRKRAPLLMRRYNFEWLYRLSLEPLRLWRRYLIGNPLFVYRVLRSRFSKKE
jgi:exopolysaccharide biosynthesis WecB/TagA/CpsF family protein